MAASCFSTISAYSTVSTRLPSLYQEQMFVLEDKKEKASSCPSPPGGIGPGLCGTPGKWESHAATSPDHATSASSGVPTPHRTLVSAASQAWQRCPRELTAPRVPRPL